MCREAEAWVRVPPPLAFARQGRRHHSRQAFEPPKKDPCRRRTRSAVALDAASLRGLPSRANQMEIPMIDLHRNSLLLGAILLAGCASQPQTAEEFRKAVPGAFLAKTETVEVTRPFRDVAANFQKRAPECL